MTLDKLSCIDVAAGENGLDRNVIWVNTIESPALLEFVHKSELVFTTGVEIKQDDDALMMLIRGSCESGAAGSVINLGPYISEIPGEVLLYAKQNNYPLLTIPWRIRLADITHIICTYILKNQGNNFEIRNYFHDLLVGGKNQNALIRQLKERGYSDDYFYGAMVIRSADDKPANSALVQALESKLIYAYYRFFSFQIDGRLVYVVIHQAAGTADVGSGGVCAVVDTLSDLLKSSRIQIGIGNFYNSVEKLRQSFREAYFTAKLASALNDFAGGCREFKKLGLYTVLIQLSDNADFRNFCRDSLQPLINYDAANETDYLGFLSVYLRNDANISKISKTLFIHRNTAIYRIKKIENILGRSLSSLQTKSELMIALAMRELF